MQKITNKERKLVVVFCVIVVFAIAKSYLFPYQHSTDAFDYHSEVVELIAEADKVYIGKNIYELLEGNYKSSHKLSVKGVNCLNDFKAKNSTGASSQKIAIRIETKIKDLYYIVYLYSSDFFYLGPYRIVDGNVRESMKLLRVNCNIMQVVPQ